MRGWAVTTLSELERLPLLGSPAQWLPVRAHFGIGAFGVNGWEADAGEEVVGPHEESDSFAGGHEELYVVLSGRAAFTIGEDSVDAEPGALVLVRDGTLCRGAVALENATVVLAVGGRPGAPFAEAAWESLVRAGARGLAGDWEGAIAETTAGLERHPDSAELLYHRACYESLAGRLDDARRDLDAAVAADPSNAERAERDPDLGAVLA